MPDPTTVYQERRPVFGAVSRVYLESELQHALYLSPKVKYPDGCVVPPTSPYMEYIRTLDLIVTLIQHARDYGFVTPEHEQHLKKNDSHPGSCHDCAMEGEQ